MWSDLDSAPKSKNWLGSRFGLFSKVGFESGKTHPDPPERSAE